MNSHTLKIISLSQDRKRIQKRMRRLQAEMQHLNEELEKNYGQIRAVEEDYRKGIEYQVQNNATKTDDDLPY